jgi:hypothetical protein
MYLMRKTNKPIGLIVVLLIAITIIVPVQNGYSNSLTQADTSTVTNTSTGSNRNFSVVWITDTQYLSEVYPAYYNSLCRWIVSNEEKYNIKMVIHTGDLVEDEWNTTQWKQADQSMSILLTNGIPYCWDAGNHDYNSTYWIGNQYSAFNPALMTEKHYWVGDEFNGQNTAIHVNIAGWDLLVINLSYHANDSAIAWASDVLDAYPNSHAIVATHAYLNEKGTYVGRGNDESHEVWAENFRETLLNKHPNVFMTLSAHFHPASGRRISSGDRDELMFNLQDAYGQLGGASLRILIFETENSKIDVKTYVVYANQFLQDQDNQFTLDTSFYNSAIPEFPVGVVLVILVDCGLVLVYCKKRVETCRTNLRVL